jgi:Flp pilus assembly protein TadB
VNTNLRNLSRMQFSQSGDTQNPEHATVIATTMAVVLFSMLVSQLHGSILAAFNMSISVTVMMSTRVVCFPLRRDRFKHFCLILLPPWLCALLFRAGQLIANLDLDMNFLYE